MKMLLKEKESIQMLAHRWMLFALFAATAQSSMAANQFVQHNLVSDLTGIADRVDPCLVNPWGIAASATSPFWVSANGTGVSPLYDGNGAAQALVVSVPAPTGTPAPTQKCGSTTFGPGSPTGIVFNGTTSFVLGAAPASFLFATEQGVIAGWNGAAGRAAVAMADRSASGAVYKGLALATRSEGSLLYAANFSAGTIDVFDGNLNQVTLAGGFRDSSIPAGFAPFNIQNLGGSLYVTYAKQDAAHHDSVSAPGNGYIDVFDLNGLLLQRLVAGGQLNAPWGLAIAPASFGDFSGDLLVGNFGDGAINAFDPATGGFLGTLQDGTGKAIHINGLWGMTFGNGSRANPGAVPSGGDANTLYFTAGIGGGPALDAIESHGLIGTLQSSPAIMTGGVSNSASAVAAISPGSYVSIFGSNLAATTRTWATADIPNGNLPKTLDGIAVTINGKPAYVYYVSQSQVNVIAPADATQGSVPVVVTNNGVASTPLTVSLQSTSPGLFTVGKYVLATHANGSLVGPTTLFPGSSTPAQPGETVVLYGTGFGVTSPAIDGTIVATPAPLVNPPQFLVGTQTVSPGFAGLVAPGLYQMNLTIPATPSGDLSISATAGGVKTQANLFITVQAATP